MISNTTIHGFKTNFQEILEVGDTLILENPDPKIGQEPVERRKINMVLSNKSMGVEEQFSFTPFSKIGFKYQKKPVVKEAEKTFEEFLAEKMQEKKQKKKKAKKSKYTEIEVRVRKGMWGYETKKIKVKGELSREVRIFMI